MKHLFTLTYFLLLTFSSWSQTLNMAGISPSYSQTGKLGGRWAYNLNITSVIDPGDKIVDGKLFPKTHTHLVLQGLLVYQLNKNTTLAGGYGFGRHNIFGLREDEPRFLAQGTYQHKVQKFTLTHRGRYELRYPLNVPKQTRSKADILRYQVWVNYPLFDQATQKQGFYLSASNEAFLYLSGAVNGPVSSKNGPLWAENWTHVGGGYTFGRTRIETGYCFQTLVRNKAQDRRNFHLLQLNVYHTINWDDLAYWWYF